MDFLELAKQRYTTKEYNPQGSVDESLVEKLKECLRLSPSSINSQPWLFTFVQSSEMKSKLAEVSFFNQPKIEDAKLLVVFSVLDNLQLLEQHIYNNLPEGARMYYERVLKHQPEEQVKQWLCRQVYISLGFFLSACAAYGLDTTTMEGIDPARYDEVLELKDYKTLFAVAVGRRSESDTNQLHFTPKNRRPQAEVIRTI